MQNWESDTSARLLHQLRTERGLSQPDLAALTGVSKQTIGNIERGETRGSYSTRSEIAAVFGVSPHLI